MPSPLFRLFSSVFFLSLFFAFAAQFVSQEQIRQSSVRCCPPQFRECCEQRMLRDERIHCAGRLGEERALSMAICLEKELHGSESVIEKRAHKCCWLLSGGEKCQRKCYDKLRAPTIPPTQKFTFTDECPSLPLNRTVPISEMDCLTDRDAVVHNCFSVCLHWWQNNWTTTGRKFDPLQHCPALVELTNSENCMVSAELLNLAQLDKANGTTEEGKGDRIANVSKLT